MSKLYSVHINAIKKLAIDFIMDNQIGSNNFL